MSSNQIAQFGATSLSEIKVQQTYSKKIKSALLEDIDGLEIDYTSHPILLLIGSLAMLSILWSTIPQKGIIALIVGLIFTAGFFSSRKIALTIHAGNLNIIEQIKGSGLTTAKDFMEKIEDVRIKKAQLVE
jgi:hypothetical protein